MARTIDVDKTLAKLATQNTALTETVQKLRAAGVPQERIATELGTTRQSVAKRFPAQQMATATTRIAGRGSTGLQTAARGGRGRTTRGR